MKIYKLERLRKFIKPTIRVTYKTWWGKLIIKDLHKPYALWRSLKNDEFIYKGSTLNHFISSDLDYYYINGKHGKDTKIKININPS